MIVGTLHASENQGVWDIKSYQMNLFKLGNVKRCCLVSRAEGSFHIFLPLIETKRSFHRYRILILRRSPNAHYFCIKAKTSFLFYATASLVETFFLACSFPLFHETTQKVRETMLFMFG